MSARLWRKQPLADVSWFGRSKKSPFLSPRPRATVAIASVYTPPDRRGRGFAGSATASLAEWAFAEGKNAVCLYTDLRNPYSNRCYAKIGFKPYSDSLHYLRAST